MLETKVNENNLYNELVRLGMNKILASDLATRFYHNEITIKDLEIVKLEHQGFIRDEISIVKDEINAVKGEIKSLKTEFDSKLKLHNWMIGIVLASQGAIVGILVSLFFYVLNKL
ncbi:Bdr family repetitive protein [Borreliella bavariensis]|uniref:Bdr family repetitive protein n=1 Tax=Borreliella bavariensis TaxID=664662 RepID=UPI00165DFFDC|nr:Bdr family repetitive protein [Borreliella bavariensis]WLN24681.1 Bdr family repetitive protein [Borreliella bavariensis]